MAYTSTGMADVTFVLRRYATVFERPTIVQLLSQFLVYGMSEDKCFCNLVHAPEEEKELLESWRGQEWKREDAVVLASENLHHVRWFLPSFKELGFGEFSSIRLGALYLEQHPRKRIYKSAECLHISDYLSYCREYLDDRGLDLQSDIDKLYMLFQECGEDELSFIQVK